MEEGQFQSRGPQPDAKRPISLLAGPYGHPFHPAVAAIPIGVWVASLLFDLGSLFMAEGQVLVKGSFWLVGIGVLGALTAAVLGFLDLFAIPRGTRVFRIGLTHMALNLFVVALFVLSLMARSSRLHLLQVPIELIVLSAIALAILGISLWLGGELAYKYGVRVADEETQAGGYR